MKYGVYTPTNKLMRVKKLAGFCAVAREPKAGYRKVRSDLLRPVATATAEAQFRTED